MEVCGVRAPMRVVALLCRRVVTPSWPSRPSCRHGRHIVVSSRRHVVTPVVAVALSCRRARRWRHALPPVASLRRRERGRVTVALRAWARVVLPPPCVLNAEQEEMKKNDSLSRVAMALPAPLVAVTLSLVLVRP